MQHTVLGQIAVVAFLAMSGGAIVWGRGALRWSGAVLLVGTILFPLLQDRHVWANPVSPLLLLDIIETVWFLGVALYDRSTALVFAAAFQLLDVATIASHLYTRAIVGPYVYITLLQVWTWGLYGSVFVGTLLARRITPRERDALT